MQSIFAQGTIGQYPGTGIGFDSGCGYPNAGTIGTGTSDTGLSGNACGSSYDITSTGIIESTNGFDIAGFELNNFDIDNEAAYGFRVFYGPQDNCCTICLDAMLDLSQNQPCGTFGPQASLVVFGYPVPANYGGDIFGDDVMPYSNMCPNTEYFIQYQFISATDVDLNDPDGNLCAMDDALITSFGTMSAINTVVAPGTRDALTISSATLALAGTADCGADVVVDFTAQITSGCNVSFGNCSKGLEYELRAALTCGDGSTLDMTTGGLVNDPEGCIVGGMESGQITLGTPAEICAILSCDPNASLELYAVHTFCEADDINGDGSGVDEAAFSINIASILAAYGDAGAVCCLVACPTAIAASGTPTICSGETVASANITEATIASDPDGTALNIIYVTNETTAGNPTTGTPFVLGTTVLTNANCTSENTEVFAYIECDDSGDGVVDSYVTAGSFTVTVNPNTFAPTAPVPNDCTVDLDAVCANDVFDATGGTTTGGANAANFDGMTGIYTAQPGDAAGTLEVLVTNEFGCTPVTFTLNTPDCSAMCPTSGTVDAADVICDGGLANEITDWQANIIADATNAAAITDNNTSANVEYSSTPINGAVTTPDGQIADGTHSGADNCVAETQTTLAYLLCFGADAQQGTADDIYLLLGTHTLTVNPAAQAPLDGISNCTNTPTTSCGTETIGATATNATGDAELANWDGTTYTAQPGDMAGTIDIIVTTTNGCSATFPINTPPCSASCPDSGTVDAADAICDGGLANEISDWQISVTADATNTTAIADNNTSANVEYSSTPIGGAVTAPDGIIADGTHSGADNCVAETQTTLAYLLCFGADAQQGTTDDIYLLLGTHTLTVNPAAQAPADGISNCTNTPTTSCGTETIGATATNATGDAELANWDGTTYTAQAGDMAGTIDITVTTANGCSATFPINTPPCSASCPDSGTVDAADAICDRGLASEITDWQANIIADATNAAAITDNNTSANIEYSSTAIGGAVTAPDGIIADGTYSGADNCAAETQNTLAYLLCFGADAQQGTADDIYLLLGTHTLTVNPAAQAPADGISNCTNTPTTSCGTETIGATATNATGDADIANWDGTTYTAQAGDMAGTIDITVTTTNGCSATFPINTPPCSASCPDSGTVDAADAICHGGLASEITDWQASVTADATNAVAIADNNTSTNVEYSSTAIGGAITAPNGIIADGTHSGADNCVAETQTTLAYLLCFGADAQQGTTDDIYLLLGTHTLTVNPAAQAPADPVADGCVIDLDPVCTNDVFVATTTTGGADIANFDASTGIYTAQIADMAGTIDITITNSFNCSSINYTLNTPACPDTGVCSITPDMATNITCDNNGTPTNPADDTFTFDITVNGSNTQVGASNTFNDDQGNLGIAYGSALSYGPYPISGGNITVNFADVDDDMCTSMMMAAPPATCSGESCGITPDMATNIVCDNNGTPTNPADDTFTFDIMVNGDNPAVGASNTFNDDQGNSGIAYGTNLSYGPYPISGGNITVNFTDVDDDMCTGMMMAAPPATCSGESCGITPNMATNITCDDNNTPANPADDTYTFNIAVNGDNPAVGASNTFNDDQGNSSIPYNTTLLYGPYLISDGNITVNFTDADNATCTGMMTAIAPDPCSVAPPCDISVTIFNFNCDNGGTSEDTTDDTVTFNYQVVDNSGSGTTWSSNEGDAGIAYGTIISVGPLAATGATWTISVNDDSDLTCTDSANIGLTSCGIPENIPTLSEWGLIILALLICIIGLVSIRQEIEEEVVA